MKNLHVYRNVAEQVGDLPGRVVLDFEAAGFRNILLVGRYTYSRAQSPLERHSHGNVFEICLLARGEQTYVARGNKYLLHGGDLFVTKPREPHGTGHTPEEPGVLYWIQFRRPGELGKLLGLSSRETRELVEQYEALGSHVYHGGMGLVPLWDRILATYAEARTHLERDTENITDIAFGLGFSSSQYFATVFRRFTGLTPRQYRKGMRHGEPALRPLTGAGAGFHPIAPS